MLAAVLALGLASCSDKSTTLQALVPADADMVVSFNLSQTLENADCKADANGITLSPAVDSLLKAQVGPDDEELKTILSIGSIDYKNIYFVFDNMFGNNGGMAAIMQITDVNDFTASLDKLGMKSSMKDGFTIYAENHEGIYLRDNIAWIIDGNPESAISGINDLCKRAEKESILSKQWMKDYLSQDRAVNAVININNMPAAYRALIKKQTSSSAPEMVDKILDGSFGFGLDLDGLKAVFSGQAFDSEGKIINLNEAYKGMKMKEISPDFIKYLNSDDVAVLTGSVPEDYPWGDFLSSMAGASGLPEAQLKMIQGYVEDLEGTVAVAFGPKQGVSSFTSTDINNSWDGIMFITLKEGKAPGYADLIESLLGQIGVTVTKDAAIDCRVADIEGTKIYMATRGNMFIIATRPVKEYDNSVFSASDFKGQYGMMVVRLDKSAPLATDLRLPFGIFSKIYSENNAGIWESELTSCSGKFLANIIEYAIETSK